MLLKPGHLLVKVGRCHRQVVVKKICGRFVKNMVVHKDRNNERASMGRSRHENRCFWICRPGNKHLPCMIVLDQSKVDFVEQPMIQGKLRGSCE